MKIKVENGDLSTEVDLYSEEGLKLVAELWTKTSCQHRLMYEPTWLGIPIIQYPNDMVMMQELIWKVRPDVIVETGVAHGGSAILHASILELLGKGKVIGIDIQIRKYNEVAIKSHPLSKRIQLIEGSSIDESIVQEVKGIIANQDKVLVVLDSNHSYEHVLREMELYSGMVSVDSYMVVMDGIQEKLWDAPCGKEEWQHDNPLRAIREFQEKHAEWVSDEQYNRLLITCCPGGFLRRIR